MDSIAVLIEKFSQSDSESFPQFFELFDSICIQINKEIIDSVFESSNNFTLNYIQKHFKKFINYNFQFGKKIRARMILELGFKFSISSPKIKSNLETKKRFYLTIIIVSYLIEYYQTVFLIADDIMDNSEIRRNKKCWYKICGISNALNDVILALSISMSLLERYLFLFDNLNLLFIRIFCHLKLICRFDFIKNHKKKKYKR